MTEQIEAMKNIMAGRLDRGAVAEAMASLNAELIEEGCKPASRFFPLSLHWMAFYSRCQRMGFTPDEICEQAAVLADFYRPKAAQEARD